MTKQTGKSKVGEPLLDSAVLENATEVVSQKEFDFDNFQLNTIEDVIEYNKHARKENRFARVRNPKAKHPYRIQVPTPEMHKQVQVKFQRFDQPENVLKTRVRTKDIDWSGQLKPGHTYTLPMPVVKFLNRLAVPIFAEVKVDDGSETKSETKQVGERNRFSCQVIDFE